MFLKHRVFEVKKNQKANWRSCNGPRPTSTVNLLLLIRIASEEDFDRETCVNAVDMQSPPLMNRDQRDFAIWLLSASYSAVTPL